LHPSQKNPPKLAISLGFLRICDGCDGCDEFVTDVTDVTDAVSQFVTKDPSKIPDFGGIFAGL